MENSATIALLIPVFNGANYIVEFCEHLKDLTSPFDEIIFYNDGSTDDSLNLIKKTGYKYITADTNKGVGAARNILAQATQCNYIHFHDIDDKFSSTFVEEVKNAITNNHAEVIFGNCDWIDIASKTVLIRWRYNQAELSAKPVDYFLTNPLGIINTAYHADTFRSINGFNEDLKCWEDADIHIRLALAGTRFKHIDSTIAFSMRHSHGLSGDQLWCWECRLKFLERYLCDYSDLLNKSTIESEIKKVQNVFILSGNFSKLKKIIDLKTKYNLRLKTDKIYILYLLSKIIPSGILFPLVKKMIK